MEREHLYVIVSTLVTEGRTLEQAMSYGVVYSDAIMSLVERFRKENATSKDIREFINQMPEPHIKAMPRYKD